MIIAVAVALGALAQSVSGIGFGLVCGPAFVAVLGQAEGVRLSVLLSGVLNLVVLARNHRDVHLRRALLLLVPAVIATPVFAALLLHAPERPAKVIAGAAAVLGAGSLAVGLRWERARGRAGAVLAGTLSAAMNDAAGIGGPAVALYADNAGWPTSQLRSTIQVYFLVLNGVALLSLGMPHLSRGRVGSVTLAAAVGVALGHLVAGRISAEIARRTTLAVAGAGGAVVFVVALAG